jgi:hypothetical protein
LIKSRIGQGGRALADVFAKLRARKTEANQILLPFETNGIEEHRIGRLKRRARDGVQEKVRPERKIHVGVVVAENIGKMSI